MIGKHKSELLFAKSQKSFISGPPLSYSIKLTDVQPLAIFPVDLHGCCVCSDIYYITNLKTAQGASQWNLSHVAGIS
jgi:hypothetical protein